MLYEDKNSSPDGRTTGSGVRSVNRSLESVSLEGEIWKPSVVDGKIHLWYSVSNYGRIASHFGNKRMGTTMCGRLPGFRGWDRSYDPDYHRILKPAPSYKNNHDPNKRDIYGNSIAVGTKMIQCARISLRLPHDFFKDINMYGSEYQYPVQGLESAMNGKCCQRTVSVHKMVAAAHMPVDDYPPTRIADGYENLPEAVKQWVRETVVINHIDHNPMNNRVENLEYVTARENTHKALKFYGGHFRPDQHTGFCEPAKEPVQQELNPLEKLL